MAHYDDSLTLRDARRAYFDANGFGDSGGYDDAWVRFKVWVMPMAFPNTASRVRAVRFHDLHHVVTGYETTNEGESEIGAWEVASGCADHRAAWALNLGAMIMGLGIAPRAVFRAFVRGRHSRNLYREEYGDALLSRSVGEVRRELGLDGDAPAATARDVAAFGAWCVIGALVSLPMGVAMPALGAGAALLARLTSRPAA